MAERYSLVKVQNSAQNTAARELPANLSVLQQHFKEWDKIPLKTM